MSRFEPLPHEPRQPPGLADGVEPDGVLHDLCALRLEVLGEELHERPHLLLGPRPVLRAEGVEGEGLEPDAARLARHRPDRLRALAVSRDAGQAARLGPAAVAVHDDGDVAWQGPRADALPEVVD